MKWKRIEIAECEITYQVQEGAPSIYIGVGRESVKEWLALFWILERDFGSVLVVPGKGRISRILALEEVTRLDEKDGVLEVAMDSYTFRQAQGFLTSYYFEGGCVVNHVDIQLSEGPHPGGYFTVGVEI